jgi:AbiJ N-terminal domain 4
MKLFSQRNGYRPIRSALQVESIEPELRSRLWDVTGLCFWSNPKSSFLSEPVNRELHTLVENLWHSYYKEPIDTIGDMWAPVLKKIRSRYFGSAWNEVYDFLEFIVRTENRSSVKSQFIAGCNKVLSQEMAGYRFVGVEITPITSEEEIATIERAVQSTGRLSTVSQHLQQAVTLFSDRTAPDYRNSIKESISAVESMCRIIADSPKATLGDALGRLDSKFKLHPALRSGFEKLYGYTSDAEGIRHSLTQEPNLKSEDAKFMLVSCSAFVNYLLAKASEGGFVGE